LLSSCVVHFIFFAINYVMFDGSEGEKYE
jgi:hypothetical protein